MTNVNIYADHPMTDYRSVLTDGVQLIDVREPDEVAAGTLPDSVNIPLGDLPVRASELAPNRRVVLFCRSGGRSAQAAEYLIAHGFGDVINLAGGMLAHQK